MDERNAHLIAFIEAITTGQTHRFEHVVKTAYMAGAHRDDLLTALEIGRLLVDVPEPVLAHAAAAVHAWHWMEARRLEHLRSLIPQAAAAPSTPHPTARGAGPAGLCLPPTP